MFVPRVLDEKLTYFEYSFVVSDLISIDIIKCDVNGNEQARFELMHDKEKGKFYGTLPLAHEDCYRLLLKYMGGRSMEIVDPAAAYLPNGILSWGDKRNVGMIWDQKSYQFKNSRPQYKKEARRLVEEIHIGTFSEEGNFAAAMEYLKHVSSLGVTDLQVMPLNATPGVFNWGYDGANWYAVNSNYGTPDDFKAFIDVAHSLGMRVILDVVYNHTGSEGSFQECLFGSISRTESGSPWGAYLNFENKGFRDFVLNNAEYWLENYCLDGLRIDAMWAIKDDYSPVHIITELVTRCRDVYADSLIVFETNDELETDPRLWKSLSEGGFGNTDKDRMYRNNDWFVDVVLRFFPEKSLFDWMLQVKDRSLTETAKRLSDLRVQSQKSFFDHDHIGNIFPFRRLSSILIDSHGNELGLSALTTIFVLGMVTKGDLMLFQGDLEGILGAPFPYFRQCLSKELQKRLRKGRLKELGALIIHNEGDLKRLLNDEGSSWDGSLDQLKKLLAEGGISEESVASIENYDAGNVELFNSAKIKRDEFYSENSRAWQKIVKKVLSFTSRTTTPNEVTSLNDKILCLKGIFAVNDLDEKYEIYSNVTKEDVLLVLEDFDGNLIKTFENENEGVLGGQTITIPAFGTIVVCSK